MKIIKKTLVTIISTLALASGAHAADNSPVRITLAGGSAGGLWSVVGEGIGDVIKKDYPGSTFSYQPGQDGANIITVTTGQAEFGMVSAPAAKWAYEGKTPYRSKIEKIRTVAYLHSMPYHFVVSKDSGIDSIEQIVQKHMPLRVAVNTKGSPMEISNRYVLESYGTSYDQIEKDGGKIQFTSITSANGQIKDNKLDGSMSPLPLPAGSLIELAISKDIKLLPIRPQTVEFLKNQIGAKPVVIKAGTYSFVDKDVPTFYIDTILIASADTPDETVYKVVKAIYGHLHDLYQVHNSFKGMTKETMADVNAAPLHPGALKFYKEIGAIK